MKTGIVVLCALLFLMSFAGPADAQEISGSFTNSIRAGTDTATCNSGRTGALRYDSTNKFYEYCTGSCWRWIGQTIYSGPSDITSGLIGYWKLDESSGTTALATYGNAGTLYNNPTWQYGGGKVNGALRFQRSSSQYVRATRYAALESQKITVAAWVKLASSGAFGFVLAKAWQNNAGPSYQSYALTMSDQNRISIQTGHSGYAAGTEATTVFSVGQWYYVVATIDTTAYPEKRIYINGVQEATSGGGLGSMVFDTSTTGDFYIGQPGSNYNYFDGVIDDVRIYNRVLTASEVSNLYTYSTTGGPDSGGC